MNIGKGNHSKAKAKSSGPLGCLKVVVYVPLSIESPGLKCLDELSTVQLTNVTFTSTDLLRLASDGEATVSRVSAVLVLLRGQYEIVEVLCGQ